MASIFFMICEWHLYLCVADPSLEAYWIQEVKIIKKQKDREPCLWWSFVWFCSQGKVCCFSLITYIHFGTVKAELYVLKFWQDHQGISCWRTKDCEESVETPKGQGESSPQGLKSFYMFFNFFVLVLWLCSSDRPWCSHHVRTHLCYSSNFQVLYCVFFFSF